jgi:hypothetical protein
MVNVLNQPASRSRTKWAQANIAEQENYLATVI